MAKQIAFIENSLKKSWFYDIVQKISNFRFKEGMLFVADNDNNRVLVWKSLLTENYTPADIVLGQSDFSHNAANDDDPDGVYITDNKLIIADCRNYRWQIFNLDLRIINNENIRIIYILCLHSSSLYSK